MLRRFLETVIDYAVCIYLVLILAVMPFYNQEGYNHIGTDKSEFFNTVSMLTGSALIWLLFVYLILMLIKYRREFFEKLRDSLSVTDLFAAGYALALVISYHYSRYKDQALWGAMGWYMGFWPQLFLVSVYFFTAKLWKPRKWMIYLMLASSGAVFLLGYLNRFGVDPLGMGTDNASFISTVGNVNWYCGYLVTVFFAGAALFWQQESEKMWVRLLLMCYVTVGFGTLVTQGSDSGVVTLAVMLLVLFALSARDLRRMQMFWQEMLLLGSSCIVTYLICMTVPKGVTLPEDWYGYILVSGWRPFFVTGVSIAVLLCLHEMEKKGIYPQKAVRTFAIALASAVAGGIVLVLGLAVVNTAWPGSIGPLSAHPFFTLSLEWGSYRGATWTIGWRCFLEQDFLHKLIGVGPDAMWAYLYREGSPELFALTRECFGMQALTNAHNEWLTVLVDTGVLGLVCFAGMMLTGIRRFLKAGGQGNEKIVFACGCSLLAHTVNCIFSFQQAMNTSALFAVFGIGAAFLAAEKNR